MSICMKITVSGKVQGVYYRAYTRKQAHKLNLTGYAKNLANGDVEIIACGQQKAINQLIAWCQKGPLLARVNQIRSETWNGQTGFTAFDIL
jgi:acylphosphatase